MTDAVTDTFTERSGFMAAWCATDLGRYRQCGGTYQWYPYESLPPLDSARFTGAFEWLGGVGAPAAEQLDGLARSLAEKGLTLPQDFRAFYTAENLRDELDNVSVTCCWTDISQPLPSPVEPGAYLVRFLRDQQDCVFWYLYLRPSGETFVVSTYLDYEGEIPQGDSAAHRNAVAWSAPSFEEFAYRFWVENRLWHLTSADLAGLEPDLREYLSHYAAA